MYILLFVSFFYISFAQGQTKPFRFGISLYPNVSAPLYITDGANQWQADIWREVEQPKFSFGGNAFVELKLAKRKTISLGLGYLNYGEQTKKISAGGFSFPDQLDPFYGFVKPKDSLGKIEFRNTYTTHSVEVPINFRFYFRDGFYTSAGLSMLAQIAHRQTTWQQIQGEPATRETRNDDREELRPLNLGLNAAFGYTFLQRKKVNLFLAANVQYIAFGIMQDVVLNRNYISAGIVTGICF
jgi:hypothetical protein